MRYLDDNQRVNSILFLARLTFFILLNALLVLMFCLLI